MRQLGNKRQVRRDGERDAAPRRDSVGRFKITEEGTLLPTAMALLPDMKPSKVKSLLRHHQLAVNGTPTSQFNRPVRAGDELEVSFDRSFRPFSHPRLKIVYEDDDVMVVDKGYGMLCTSAGGTHDETVFNVLRSYVKGNDRHARIFVVHRLDRDTSGLMLLVRTDKARDIMVQQWNNMVLDRRYVAVVDGVVEKDKGMVQNYLYDAADNYRVESDDDPACGGKIAKTCYTVLRRTARHTMVELTLHTGHKNQLRVHMRDLGHPISGDRKYGGRSNPIHRLALHATLLRFVHPVTGRTMTFESAIPAQFNTLIGSAR